MVLSAEANSFISSIVPMETRHHSCPLKRQLRTLTLLSSILFTNSCPSVLTGNMQKLVDEGIYSYPVFFNVL